MKHLGVKLVFGVKNFDSHDFITHELNPIFYSLKVKVSRELPFAWIRHENRQLSIDDWRSDIRKDLDRSFDELTQKALTLSPSEILNWTDSLVSSIESYGQYYWAEAEEIYIACLSTSLLDYLNDEEADEIMEKHQKKWTTYIKNLRTESQALLTEIEKMGKQKEALQTEMFGLNEKLGKLKTEQNELKRITTRNKIARFIDGVIGKI